MNTFRNQFAGYPEGFYRYGIPFNFSTMMLDESFEGIVEKIKDIENVPGLFQDLSLPESKSFKRIIYNEPGFLFYLPEIKKTWELVEDISLLNKVLRSSYSGSFLSALHSLPKIESFFCDYKNLRGAKELVKLIDCEWIAFFNYAAYYILMDENGQTLEKKCWNYKYFKSMEATSAFNSNYSVLKPAVNNTFKKNIVNDKIGDFRFVLLKSTGEYYIAGALLDNCLREFWRWIYSDVVAIYKEEDIVGAVEISGNSVIQAKTKHNKELNEIDGLEEALGKWVSKYGLIYYTPGVIIYSEEDSIIVGLMYNEDVSNVPIVTYKKVLGEPMDEALKHFEGLTCVNNPSLSRKIFFTSDIYDRISKDLYTPVAEIWANIFIKNYKEQEAVIKE